MADTPRGPFADTIPTSAPPADESPGAAGAGSERYRLGAELGRGGMGRVVEAFDLALGRTVALKEALPRGGPGTLRRFAREVQLTARLEHPSIVPLYDAGTTPDGRPFYVMRRVSGRPLEELIARARGLDERLTLLPALLAAIDAIAHAHRRGVIHRDLKPANILVGELGETVVIDWGLAKVIGEDDDGAGLAAAPADSLQTQIGAVFGTPGFMAPEQARGEQLGTHGDVYALGATLYQLLAGTPPHAGTSATEVIEKTHRHEIRPLVEVASGAPAELVAIVDKALSFEAAGRYPDAGALAEDVRRFLAGQLVAAHQYTTRQRVARFARRHRAPLGVAALAMVAVAVLAWIGVHRIVQERDAADEARHDAIAGRAAAEQARDALSERHDALIVTQARGLLATSPTEAAATLKALSAGSPRSRDGGAVAQAAAVRGAAWALPTTHELTLQVELDPESRRLLQTTRDGVVRVWDLDQRRLVIARPYPRGARALWVEGGRVLVYRAGAPPELLEPAANSSEPLAIEPIVDAVATERGDRVLVSTGSRTQLLDLATRAVQPLAGAPSSEGDQRLAIAPDGSWLAVADRSTTVVLDPSGRELLRHAAEVVRLVPSGARTLAILGSGSVVECRLDPQPACGEVPLGPGRTIDLAYRGRELFAFTSSALVAWDGARVASRGQFDGFTSRLVVAAGEALIVPTADGKLHYQTSLARGALVLPSVLPHVRVATRPSSSRVVALGDGLVAVFDLSPVIPRRLAVPSGAQVTFVDDDTLLVGRGGDVWSWYDLITGKTTEVRYRPEGMPLVADVDATSGRVLIRELGGRQQRLVLFRKQTADVQVIAAERLVWGRLIEGDGLVFSVGDGRLFGQRGDAPPAVVVKLEGEIEAAASLGPGRFAARSDAGELVRGELSGGSIERARVLPGTRSFLVGDPSSRGVVLVEERRIELWATSITEIARFDKPIAHAEPVEGGLCVMFADHEVQLVPLVAGARPHRLLAPSKRQAVVSADGRLLAGVGAGGQVELVELPSRARWSLPGVLEANDALALSPSTRRLIQGGPFALAYRHLPGPVPDLGAFLDDQTNAIVDDDGVLAWPWQRGAAP